MMSHQPRPPSHVVTSRPQSTVQTSTASAIPRPIMSWLSRTFSFRKRTKDSEDGDQNTERPGTQESEDGFLGSMFKRLKSDAGKVTDAVAGGFEVKAEDSLSYAADSDTNIAPLVSSILVPRPLVLVAWNNAQGDLSIVPTSFCSIVSEDPAYISIGLPEASVPEDTSVSTVGRTKEFTVSVVSEWLSKAAMRTAGTYELPEQESDLNTGLTTTASEQVEVPRVSEAAASLECTMHNKVTIKDQDGQVTSIVVIAKVVNVIVNKNVLTTTSDGDAVADVTKLKPVAALGNDLSGYVTQPFTLATAGSLATAASTPLSPRSPGIKEVRPQLSPAVADTAEVVANAVIDALTADTNVPANATLGDAHKELAETVLDAVEQVLEPGENDDEVFVREVDTSSPSV